MSTSRTLSRRTFGYKNYAKKFFCPLCGTERALFLSSRMTMKNYAQMSLITIFIVTLLFPWFGFKSSVVLFMIWPIFEGLKRLKFKSEVPCPHCGFDATLYKKDVRKAREVVEKFWEKN